MAGANRSDKQTVIGYAAGRSTANTRDWEIMLRREDVEADVRVVSGGTLMCGEGRGPPAGQRGRCRRYGIRTGTVDVPASSSRSVLAVATSPQHVRQLIEKAGF